MSRRTSTIWTFAITSVALFMTTLDNLVVTTALPVIHRDLHASLSGLEWTVNAYTLTFAVFLITGAALGDRFGRRRMFVIGLAIFTAGSAAAALAPSIEALIVARAVQGFGGAIVLPLTLTILSAAVPAEKRGLALGAWGGISGLAVAIGPLVGGAVVQGISWQWIFWLNVPIGLVLIPLAALRLQESRGPNDALDLPGVGLASAGLFGIVWGLVRGNSVGWGSPEIVFALLAGVAVLALFVLWELRADEPMLPLRFFRNRTFTAANVASLLMFFGMFGSIFLLAQFFQTVQGYSPLQAGLRILPWTAMPIFVAPIAGRALGPHRRPAADGHRAGAASYGARVDRGGLDADGRLLGARRAVHPLGRRDGALLRAGRQRRALVRSAGGGGPGLRRQQRDPRARRRLRRGRARFRVRALRRLPHGADLRRRARRLRSTSARASSPQGPWRRSVSRARCAGRRTRKRRSRC